MFTITKALIAEHAFFLDLFDQIDHLLPAAASLGEIRLLGNLVERLLQRHGETEKDLAYTALDHVLQDKGHLDRMHQDHQEIDACLRRVQSESNPMEARRLLKAAILASREHFRREEQFVFPAVERALQGATLAELGDAWMSRRATAEG
jgi:hemerythrin-like domain-containing protein